MPTEPKNLLKCKRSSQFKFLEVDGKGKKKKEQQQEKIKYFYSVQQSLSDVRLNTVLAARGLFRLFRVLAFFLRVTPIVTAIQTQ